MSKKTTKDADGHPTYAHRHRHTSPSHHVGPCSANDRAGRSDHHHRRSGERMTPAVAARIYRRYFNRDRKRGRSTAYARAEAARVSGAIVRRAAVRGARASAEAYAPRRMRRRRR